MKLRKFAIMMLSLPLLAAVTACQKIELEEYDFEKHICEFSDELVHMYILHASDLLDVSLMLEDYLSGIVDDEHPSFDGTIDKIGEHSYKMVSEDMKITIKTDGSGKSLHDDSCMLEIIGFEIDEHGYIYRGSASVYKKPSEDRWLVKIGEVTSNFAILIRSESVSAWTVESKGIIQYRDNVCIGISTKDEMMVDKVTKYTKTGKKWYDKTYTGGFYCALYQNNRCVDNCLSYINPGYRPEYYPEK